MTTLGTDKHVHQMFPLKDNETTFNENLYGYVCVPISTEWLPGKKYIYTLEFCGQESGAGIYPPEDDMTDLGLPTGGDGKNTSQLSRQIRQTRRNPEIQFSPTPSNFQSASKTGTRHGKTETRATYP